jgi:hypothetical protein
MEICMTSEKKNQAGPAELKAVGAVYSALENLEHPVQLRVLRYAAEMLGLEFAAPSQKELPSNFTGSDSEEQSTALKWMRRSDLNPKSLQDFFSLGIDDIDLVAKSVPGSNKKERMRSVLLLKAIAAYLGTGAARVSYEQLKEACLHYNAYDGGNFAAYLKSFASEVGGAKESGFTLTARGLSAATVGAQNQTFKINSISSQDERSDIRNFMERRSRISLRSCGYTFCRYAPASNSKDYPPHLFGHSLYPNSSMIRAPEIVEKVSFSM